MPVDPLTTNQVEVIRGPATLRFGSQAIGGVVETTNNRIPSAACGHLSRSRAAVQSAVRGPCVNVEIAADDKCRQRGSTAPSCSMPAAAMSRCMPTPSAARREITACRNIPIWSPPNPAMRPMRRSQARSTASSPTLRCATTDNRSARSYIFDSGFFGIALTQNNALYHIPGIDGEDHNTRIDAHQTKLMTKGEWRAPISAIDAVRFWAGVTDYKHNEIGLADATDLPVTASGRPSPTRNRRVASRCSLRR